MDFETRYHHLVPDFTKHISEKRLPFLIAPGTSASDLASEMQMKARDMGLPLPEIYKLSRKESRDMYYRVGLDPINVIRGILAINASIDNESQQVVNFLDDYTWESLKAYSMDTNLFRSIHRYDYSFFFHIMVGGYPARRDNVDIFRIDQDLSRKLDEKYNSAK